MDNALTSLEISKLKLELKLWEVKFQEQFGRKPNQDDIVNAGSAVRDMYKTYSRAKSQALSNKSNLPKTKSAPVRHCDVWSSKLNKDTTKDANGSQINPTKKLTSHTEMYASKLRANITHMQQKKHANDEKRHSVLISKSSNSRTCDPLIENDNEKEMIVDDNGPDVLQDNTTDEMFKLTVKIKVNATFRDDFAEAKALNASSNGTSTLPCPNTQRRIFSHLDVTSQELPTKSLSDSTFDCLSTSKLVERSGDSKDSLHNTGYNETGRSDNYKTDTLHEKSQQFTDYVQTGKMKKNMDRTIINNLTDKRANLSENENMKLPSSNVKRIGSITDVKEKRVAHKLQSESLVKEDAPHAQGVMKRSRKMCNDESINETSNKKIKCISNTRVPRVTALAGKSRKMLPKENYVRINLKKKIFVRGKKNFNYRRYKYAQWKKLKQDNEQTSENTRFLNSNGNNCNVVPEDSQQLEPGHGCSSKFDALPEISLKNDVDELDEALYTSVDPLIELHDNKPSADVLDDMCETLELFGYSNFRSGQMQAIARILAGLSTLLIQPTGSGKSLCYLLPAYMYSRKSACITLVISPLVSLMEDQVDRVPSFLKAACINTNMTTTQREKVKQAISNKKLDILYLSPEALVKSGGSIFGAFPADMAPIAFVCIDEVHCVSAWSHNFRPSYLRLCKIIRETLKVNCILGLTATATNTTIDSIVSHLNLSKDSNAVIRGMLLPTNLQLTVSNDHGEKALLNLLDSEPYFSCQSIIIYCIRREQTERLAMLIRTCLKQKTNEWCAEAYHAGMTAARRKKVQNSFMSGKLKVIVATVAFGMGLNKSDVRAVIHYNMPKSIESYIQEVGRAGRDGERAYCHVFLEQQGEDRQELRRHIFADTVDRAALRKLLRRVFQPCKCHRLQELESTISEGVQSGNKGEHMESSLQTTWTCPGHEVAFPIQDTVEEMDLKEEGIDTLLCYLDLHPNGYVQLLQHTYGTCSIICYGGSEQLKSLSKKCAPVALGLKFKNQTADRRNSNNSVEFSLVKVATLLGCDSSVLRRQLLKLQWTESKNADGKTTFRKSGVIVNFKDLSFHVRAVGNLLDEKIDEVLTYLHDQVLRHEHGGLQQLETFYQILNSVSFAQHGLCQGNEVLQKSDTLKNIIREYFDNSPAISKFTSLEPSPADNQRETLGVRTDIRNFLNIYNGECTFPGRAIARIFHGIGSPRYPVEVWGRVRRFWRCHLDFDFNELCKMATEEILLFR